MTAADPLASAVPAAPLSPGPRFEDLAPEHIVRAFGVEYAHLRPAEGGDLYVTRLGWPQVRALVPSSWYTDEWFARHGTKLPGSTGHAYHVRTRPVEGVSREIVVKFSRMAQEVPIIVESTFPEHVPPEIIAEARFNSPLEEFGLLSELREREGGTAAPRILTQHPLAIYAPPERFDLWELGRRTSTFFTHAHQLAENQVDEFKAIELDIRRIYVLLYGWVEGRDAEQCCEAGELEEAEIEALTRRVTGELAANGFRVLDGKPRHFVLRSRRDGTLLRDRDGRLPYALVDFELLQRTPENQRRFKTARREAYGRLQSGPPRAAPPDPRSHLRITQIFGVDYVFGALPDGGRLWVVGREPGLFDYFLPDRWRRTPRVKLSSGGEVYRTRSRDNIDLVYRKSRVGLVPRADPFTPTGKRIREGGYNSPFEEVAIAQRLRETGVATTTPRAIHRTGHRSVKALRLHDPRRFAGHAERRTPEPEPEPILAPEFDYYTLWDTFRGADHPRGSGVDLVSARESGRISSREADDLLEDIRLRLARAGLPAEGVTDDEFEVCLDEHGDPGRGERGIDVLFSLDALSAYEFGLLDEPAYVSLMARMNDRLRAADFEKLDPNGRHLLLTMDPDARLQRDAAHELRVTLCNFALIRGLYRPVR